MINNENITSMTGCAYKAIQRGGLVMFNARTRKRESLKINYVYKLMHIKNFQKEK